MLYSLDCYFHAPTRPSVPHQSLGVPTSIMWSLPSLPCSASTAQMSSPPKISEHVSTHNLYLPRQGTGQLVIAMLRGFHYTLRPTPQLYLSPVRHGNLLKHGWACVGLPVPWHWCPPVGKGERISGAGDAWGRAPRRPLSLHSHVGLVVLPNLLDTHIIFGINEGLSSGIRLSQCHNTCNVLEVMLVVYLDLWA